jgi:release factor glutamine methyltransferase
LKIIDRTFEIICRVFFNCQENNLKLAEAKKTGEDILREAGIRDAEWDSREILFYVTGIDYNSYLLKMDDEMDDSDLLQYGRLIGLRSTHIPLQHITHSQNFMGFDFYVTDDVLVPRQDTETLVEYSLAHLKENGSILDVCTGSGCILISMLKLRPDTSGMGLDISPEALKIASENAKNLEVDDRSVFMSGDLFSPLEKISQNGNGPKFSMIVSNPPYIPTMEILGLDEEVREHDPLIALDGGRDGLDFYRRIIDEAGNYLEKDGYLVMETGYDETEMVMSLMNDRGYREVGSMKDMGNNPRIVFGML